MACKHMNFHAQVNVHRFDDLPDKAMAHLTIKCTECGTPFQFRGLPAGLHMDGAAVSFDGLEARLAIVPQGSEPTALTSLHPMHEGGTH